MLHPAFWSGELRVVQLITGAPPLSPPDKNPPQRPFGESVYLSGNLNFSIHRSKSKAFPCFWIKLSLVLLAQTSLARRKQRLGQLTRVSNKILVTQMACTMAFSPASIHWDLGSPQLQEAALRGLQEDDWLYAWSLLWWGRIVTATFRETLPRNPTSRCNTHTG